MSYFLAYFRMVDLLGHFRQHLRFWIKQTWLQVHQSKILCSQCNFILGLELMLLKTVGIREPLFPLHATSVVVYPLSYLIPLGETSLPTAPPADGTTTASRHQVPGTEVTGTPPPPPNVCATRPQWMSVESIHLIDSRTDLCHCPDHNRNQARTLM